MLTFLLLALTSFLNPFNSVAHASLDRCIQESIPMTIQGQSPYVKLKLQSSGKNYSGDFLVDTGTTFSSVDHQAIGLAFSNTPAYFTADAFFFFGSWMNPTFALQDHSNQNGTLKQAGILGTDFLASLDHAFDFETNQMHRIHFNTECTSSYLREQGMIELQSNTTLANVPTVPIQLGGVTALAQIDTGYNDSYYSFAININRAYEALLIQNQVHLFALPHLDQVLSTCVAGVYETVKAYRLPHSLHFNFLARDGSEVQSQNEVHIFVKDTPPQAKICGGIGTWEKPAAQLGGSFLKSIKHSVFKAGLKEVWFSNQ